MMNLLVIREQVKADHKRLGTLERLSKKAVAQSTGDTKLAADVLLQVVQAWRSSMETISASADTACKCLGRMVAEQTPPNR